MLAFLEPKGLTKKGKSKWKKTFPYLPEYNQHGVRMAESDSLQIQYVMNYEDFVYYWEYKDFLDNVEAWLFATGMFRGIAQNQLEKILVDNDYEKSGMELLLGNLFSLLSQHEDRLENMDEKIHNIERSLP